MGKARKRVPDALAAKVMFAADRACCICHKRDLVQTHHIDGDHSNNAWDNLALLCLKCHHRASTKGGVARHYTPRLVKTYRDDWYRLVRERRKSRTPRARVTAEPTDRLLDAVAAHEVRKIGYTVPGVPREWAGVAQHIQVLAEYGRDFGPIVKSEILSVLYELACFTRSGMPAEVAATVDRILQDVAPLPWFAIGGFTRRKPHKAEIDLIQRAAYTAGTMAYDGAKYLHDIKVVDHGGRILAACLKYARVAKVAPVLETCMESFATALGGAKDGGFLDGELWLTYLRDDALADPGAPAVPMPELEKPLFGFGRRRVSKGTRKT